jgi:hypothetical protein
MNCWRSASFSSVPTNASISWVETVRSVPVAAGSAVWAAAGADKQKRAAARLSVRYGSHPSKSRRDVEPCCLSFRISRHARSSDKSARHGARSGDSDGREGTHIPGGVGWYEVRTSAERPSGRRPDAALADLQAASGKRDRRQSDSATTPTPPAGESRCEQEPVFLLEHARLLMVPGDSRAKYPTPRPSYRLVVLTRWKDGPRLLPKLQKSRRCHAEARRARRNNSSRVSAPPRA